MSERYADSCFTISPPKARGLARLSKPLQQQKIQSDTRDWLGSGHAITELPSVPCPGIKPKWAFARGDDDGPF